MKAILVEDERIMQRSFERLSSDIEGFTLIRVFDDAYDAMSFSEENEYDAAFIDILLPGIDGYQLAAMLRMMKPQIKIVFVSALEKEDYEGYGAVGLLKKPYTRDELTRIIERMNA